VEGWGLRGRRYPSGEAAAAGRPRARTNPAEGPRGIPAFLRPRPPDHEEGRVDGAGPAAAIRAPGDGTADRVQSGGGPESIGPSLGEGCGSPERPRGPHGRGAGSDPLILKPLARDPERRARPFFPVPMLVQDRRAGAGTRPLEPDDRLRVVAQHVADRKSTR